MAPAVVEPLTQVYEADKHTNRPTPRVFYDFTFLFSFFKPRMRVLLANLKKVIIYALVNFLLEMQLLRLNFENQTTLHCGRFLKLKIIVILYGNYTAIQHGQVPCWVKNTTSVLLNFSAVWIPPEKATQAYFSATFY